MHLNKPIFIVRQSRSTCVNLRTVDITVPLAIHAAELRKKYYSKKNAFSYNDGLYLATALVEHVEVLITTDPHTLSVSDVKAIPPSQYR